MSQSTLDDDELFGEAASEIRSDVESSLAAAHEALPDGTTLLETEADNVIGVLNTLKSSLDVEEAQAHLHEAKKWYTMGTRAGAFDDAEDLAEEIEQLETTIEEVETASQQATELASTIPALRDQLDG